jgi:hypothetical protein
MAREVEGEQEDGASTLLSEEHLVDGRGHHLVAATQRGRVAIRGERRRHGEMDAITRESEESSKIVGIEARNAEAIAPKRS